MKEIKTGDHHYKSKGLVKVVGRVPESTKKLYIKAAAKRGWSFTKFFSFWIKKKAPK